MGIGTGATTPHTVPLAFLVCIEWGRTVEAASEAEVMDGLDFFVAGVGSVCTGAATAPARPSSPWHLRTATTLQFLSFGDRLCRLGGQLLASTSLEQREKLEERGARG
jgi:hypothetical protein